MELSHGQYAPIITFSKYLCEDAEKGSGFGSNVSYVCMLDKIINHVANIYAGYDLEFAFGETPDGWRVLLPEGQCQRKESTADLDN